MGPRRLRIVRAIHVLGKEVDVVKRLVRRWSADEGQGLAEYALILALIAVVCITGTAFFGQQVTDTLSFIGKNIGDVLP
jgi:Flp pilus assembly pilin Flp